MRKRYILYSLLLSTSSIGQALPDTERALENIAAVTESELEDDSWLQSMEAFRRDPLDLNTATENELHSLQQLNDVQVQSLLAYRKQFGKLISIYELQAVPLWTVRLIRQLLPFVKVSDAQSFQHESINRIKSGTHSFLLRVSRTIEKSEGYRKVNGEKRYKGSAEKILFRYRYAFKNNLQYGITGEKDAGEEFFSGSQRKGFDFYSFHLFAKKLKHIEAVALGDYTVNMGQGLIHWQSLSFRKGGDITAIKRQSMALRPYSSAGEFNFLRGAGITMRSGKMMTTVFISSRKKDANLVTDPATAKQVITSFLQSGNHRTTSELQDKFSVKEKVAGAIVEFRNQGFKAAINGVVYGFDEEVSKRNEPYNHFSWKGKRWWNSSLDMHVTLKNIHLFNEVAMDAHKNIAFIQGMLICMDTRADISVVYRKLTPAYQSVAGNAFTESTLPTNETGIYTGITVRPYERWRIDMYNDIYKFPWLRYGIDAPGYGSDQMLQIIFSPSKKVELSARFKSEMKTANETDNTTVNNFLSIDRKRSLRMQVEYAIDMVNKIRWRAEALWLHSGTNERDDGFSIYMDHEGKVCRGTISTSIRLQYFETGGYGSRIYGYEHDVLFSSSIPALFNRGVHGYINISRALNERSTIWLRLARTTYLDGSFPGTGQDAISVPGKTDLKLQIRYEIG